MNSMKNRMNKYRVFLLLSVAVFVISCGVLAKEWFTRQKEKNTFDELSEMILTEGTEPVSQETDGTKNNEEMEQEETNEEGDTQEVSGRNMGLLYEINKNCVGWLCIPNTTINYPVMHTPDNPQQYLRQDFYGEYSQSGTPFIDGRCSLDSDNIIIYGHNMKNGTMFSDLKNYVNSEYGKENQTVEFQTSSVNEMYTVIAVIATTISDEWYNFISADTEEEFNAYVSKARQLSLYELKMPDKYEKQLITMSTCYGSQKNGRLLVIAIKNPITYTE